jgi:hypothetical protein
MLSALAIFVKSYAHDVSVHYYSQVASQAVYSLHKTSTREVSFLKTSTNCNS